QTRESSRVVAREEHSRYYSNEMPWTRRSPVVVAIQGALLVAMTVLLIQPKAVPDPFRVGASLSWTVICLIAAAPTLGEAIWQRDLPRTALDALLWAYVASFILVFPFSVGRVTSALWVMSLLANVLVFYAVVATTRDAQPWVGVVLLTIAIGVA